jgi:hypothetical protein
LRALPRLERTSERIVYLPVPPLPVILEWLVLNDSDTVVLHVRRSEWLRYIRITDATVQCSALLMMNRPFL